MRLPLAEFRRLGDGCLNLGHGQSEGGADDGVASLMNDEVLARDFWRK